MPRREILRDRYSIAVGCHMAPNVGIECDFGLQVRGGNRPELDVLDLAEDSR